MIEADNRAQLLLQLNNNEQWDMVVIGGGVVGAGIFKYANQLGLKVLLLEQKDYAWGSSSRSSKMVHGGLRYVAQGQADLTREAVRERELLIEKAAGLVSSTSYVFSHRRWKFPGRWAFTILMWIYSRFAGRKQHRTLSKADYMLLMPGIGQQNLLGGTQYVDALTDDARLVFRLIQEARSHGAVAANYTKVEALLREGERVIGVKVRPEDCNESFEIKAKMVVNATGAWADKLDPKVILRPLRGSHIVVPSWRLPIASVLTLLHPKDRRPIMIYPWQNAVMIGTTDLDHEQDMDVEPHMTREELDYIYQAVESEFPGTRLQDHDLLSSFAGVRPIVLDRPVDKKVAASAEKREHSLFFQPGFITVTGGKLTTFRVIANDVIAKAADTLGLATPIPDFVLFENAQTIATGGQDSYLAGRYGRFIGLFREQCTHDQTLMRTIRYSKTLWGELLFAVRYEQVVHLDDLLLRRTRIGNVLPGGGKDELPTIRRLCQFQLNWSDEKWQQEQARYLDIWQKYYSLPHD